MSIIQKVILLAVTFLLLTCHVQASDVLKVGVYQDEPTLFTNTENEADGITIDVLKAYAEENDIVLKYYYGTLGECMDLLREGTIDVLPDLIYTDERAEEIAFSKTFLMVNWGVLVTHNEMNIETIQQMEGIKVAVVKEDRYSGVFMEMVSNFGLDVAFMEVETYEEVVRLINSKMVDAGVLNRLAFKDIEVDFEVHETPIVFNPSEIRYGFRKDMSYEEIALFDHFMEKLKADPTSLFYTSVDRWFGTDEETLMLQKQWPYAALVILLILGLWVNLRLTKRREHLKEKALRETEDELKKESIRSQKSEDRIYTMAYYDELTEMENKTSLYRDLADMCDMDDPFAVIFFDLDNFKVVNDSLGYIQGDRLIQKVARRLKSVENQHSNLYRWGGDEFVFIYYDYKSEDDVENFAKGIIQMFNQCMLTDTDEFYLTSSIGISFFKNQGETHEDMIRKATTALHEIKQSGKNGYMIHTQQLSDRILEKVTLGKELKEAITNKSFIVHYQPRVHVQTGVIMGMEALVRWWVPGKGMISPVAFIPLAEETGLIKEIDYLVMQQACKDTKAWNDAGHPIMVSINLSACHFQDHQILDEIQKALDVSGVNPSSIEFEITESAIMQDIEFATKIINKIRANGMRVLLDDFGTGYSSLNHLKKLPLDILKIDKSFMDCVLTESKERAITESVINLAHSLGLSVVAEGVEYKEQIQFLNQYGCDEYQGYYYSKPINAENFGKLLKIQKVAI